MSFHNSLLGIYSGNVIADMGGYVPEENDGPWDFQMDHTEKTHNDDGTLTEYGQWWEEDGFPEWKNKSVQDTKKALDKIAKFFKGLGNG